MGLFDRGKASSESTTTFGAAPISSEKAKFAYTLLEQLLKGNDRLRSLFGKYGGDIDLTSLIAATQIPGAFDTKKYEATTGTPASASTVENIGSGLVTLAALAELINKGSTAYGSVFGKTTSDAKPPVLSINGIPLDLWKYSIMPESQPYGLAPSQTPTIDYGKMAPDAGGSGSSTFLDWLGSWVGR